jgi:hypothetical protein
MLQSAQLSSAHPIASLCVFALPCMPNFSYIKKQIMALMLRRKIEVKREGFAMHNSIYVLLQF